MRVNTFVFEVHETWLGGITVKHYEIKAGTAKAAQKRILQLAGNRTWDVTMIDSRPGVQGDWPMGGWWRLGGGNGSTP